MTNYAQSPKNILTIDDLPDLRNLLSPVKQKCVYIGLQLGVSDHTIQSIITQHASHLDQLCEILQHRVNQVPPLTVNDIVQALTSRVVGENIVAREVQSHYGNQALTSASPQVSAEPLLVPFSTTAQSMLTCSPTPDLPTGSLASEASSSRLEIKPLGSSISNSPQVAHLPAQTPYQISSQPVATPTNTTYQHYTGQQPPHPHHMLPSYIPQPVPYSGPWWGMHTPVPPQQPYYHHLNPYYSAFTHDHLHKKIHQQVSQYQSQQQDISNYASQMKSSDTPPAKRLHLETLHDTSEDCGPPSANIVHQDTTCTMDQFIDYIKTIYKQSVIENNLNVIKWPPTPSKMFINLACIDWRTVMTEKEADEFTRAMVEDGNVDVIMKKKTPIEFSEIVQDLPDTGSGKVILVEGAPGVGKSTFAWEFCRKWERGEIAQQYHLVLLLRLKDETIRNAQSLQDLLYHPSCEISDAVGKHLTKILGEKCLIILEGVDDLPDTCRMESAIFVQLINGKLLPLATILVTSRPWAASALLDMCHHRILKHIKILGFTETQIEEYVRSVFTDEKWPENDPMQVKDIEDTMSYIATYPQIKACMYIPLNSAIVVSVYQESKAGRCILPKTLTELYYALTQTLLLRYIRGHPVHKKIRHIQSFEKDLPQEVYEQLLNISAIAYYGICKDWGDSVQLIFSDLPPTFETLGLMQIVSQMYVTQGVKVSHNFLHLTIQEFLAALHIFNLSSEEQLKHFKRHKEGRFRLVLRFLAGLSKLLNISLEHRRALLGKSCSHPAPKQRLASMVNPHNVSAQDTSYTQMKSDISVSVQPLNWLFETQSSDVIKAWLQEKTVEFKFPRQMSPLEYYSAGYCIAHSSARWVLTIQEHIEETDLKMFCHGITSTEEADFKIGLKVLVHMATEMIETLLTKLGPHIQELHLKLRDGSIVLENLSALQVLHLELNCKKTFDFTPSLLPQSLESLTVEAGRGNNVLGLKSYATIRVLAPSLKYLKFTSGKKKLHDVIRKQMVIDSKSMELITKAMADNASLQLRSLQVDCACTFTVTAAEWLTTFITNSKQLQNLHIGPQCTLEQEGIESLLKALANNDSLSLKSLILPTLKVSDTAADSLLLLINKCATLEFISWGEEQTTLIIACGLREMANDEQYSWLPQGATEWDHHCVVNCLEDGIDFDHIWQHHSFHGAFTCHNIGDEGACFFAASLIKNSIVTRLYFNCNHAIPALTKVLHQSRCYLPNTKISDAGATALAQALHHNSTLQQLHLSNNGISDAGATALAQALHHKSALQELHLSNNSISNAGATVLAQALEHNSTLGVLDLSNNSISDTGVTALAQAIHHNSTLRMLHLSNNNISDAGATALAQAIHHYSALRMLDVSNNSVSDAGATAIAQVLHHNSTLWKLDLSNNSITYVGMTAVAQALHYNFTLWVLQLSNNSVSDAGATAVAQALHHNSTLQELDLSNNSITDAGVTAVAQALHHNSTLQELDLSNNSITDAGVTAVAQALHHNSTLQQLDLSNNSVSDAGTTAIAQALHHNSTLEKLDLSNNSITDAGVTAVAQALHYNSTLEVLDLSNNSIGDAGATALAQGFHHVSRLCGLNLSGNDAIHKEGTCELVHALTVATYPERWWTHCDGLVLPKRCEEFATQCPDYSEVKSRVKFLFASDAEGTATAQVLHQNSTLMQQDLSKGNIRAFSLKLTET